jgi:hypothetical protein
MSRSREQMRPPARKYPLRLDLDQLLALTGIGFLFYWAIQAGAFILRGIGVL